MKVPRLVPRVATSRVGVRMRLTLLFGGLFLVAGAALLGITYGLVNHASQGIIIRNSSGSSSDGGQAAGGAGGQAAGSGTSIGGLEITGGSGSLASLPAPQQIRWIAAQSASGTGAAENNALLVYSGVALAIMAAASIALGWFVAGRALRPLRRITAAAQRISATSLRERLAVDGPADDLRELADTIDGLFARLDASLDAQRLFVANASHELRTPLTRARTLLEVALLSSQARADSTGLDGGVGVADTLRTACERAIAAADEQERLIEALLTLARGQRGLARRDPVDLAAVTRDVLAVRGAEITARGLAMNVILAPALMAGDKALTERAVANLIDNALRHNNDDGGRVWVNVGTTHAHAHAHAGGGDGGGDNTARASGGRGAGRLGNAVLSVANTGPEVPRADIGRLLQPFQRREAGRAASRNGLGLGLSIVQAAATAHGAELLLVPREAGGLEAELVFPSVPGDFFPAALNNLPGKAVRPGAPAGRAPGRTPAVQVAYPCHGVLDDITGTWTRFGHDGDGRLSRPVQEPCRA